MPPLEGDGCAGVSGFEGVVVDLAARSASGEGCDKVVAIENVMGSAFSDSISGVPGSVNGGGGADFCRGEVARLLQRRRSWERDAGHLRRVLEARTFVPGSIPG